MAEWVEGIHTATKYLDAGRAEESSEVCRQYIKDYAHEPNVTHWFLFNLMKSESVLKGPHVAQEYLLDIANTNITWAIKLYTLELALGSASPGDDNLQELYNNVLYVIEKYCAANVGDDEINIMSCHGITRHVHRLFGVDNVDSCFQFINNEEDYTATYAVIPSPTLPITDIEVNRWPHILKVNHDHYTPPERNLSFRHVGRAYMLRLGVNTLVFDAKGQLLSTPYGNVPAFLKTLLERKFKTLKVKTKIKGPSVFIGDYFSQALNYCHWVFDWLLRIVAADTAGLPFRNIVGVFEEKAEFQTATLGKLLSPQQKYLAISAQEGLFEFDDFYFADNNSIRHIHHPFYSGDANLTMRLREKLLVGTPVSDIKKRLYVPRRHNRVVMNEAPLIELLSTYGFESVDTDKMSFSQQVEAFASAEVIIGPHGAALTNLLFAPPSCRVMEFFPPFGGSASFYLASSAMGFDYAAYIDDTSQGPDKDANQSVLLNTAGIWVDTDFVAQWLKNKLGELSHG